MAGESLLEIVGESFEEWRGKKSKFKVKNRGEEKINWRGGRWNLYGSFTDGFSDGYKINYYFNLFRRWSVKNPSVIFEFRTKIFNDPPYFSWSVGNSVDKMTRSHMHIMHNPLEFAQSVGNFIGNINPPANYQQTYIRRYWRRWLWHFK